MAKIKKYQVGGKAKMVESEMFPGKKIPASKSNYETGKIGKMAEAPKAAAKAAASKAPVAKKKMQKGGSLGMKSVKAGYDKNPGVTRADIIVAGKGEAKYGKKMKKAKHGASITPSKKSVSSNLGGYKKTIGKAKSGAKMMMGGGKCKYGCK